MTLSSLNGHQIKTSWRSQLPKAHGRHRTTREAARIQLSLKKVGTLQLDKHYRPSNVCWSSTSSECTSTSSPNMCSVDEVPVVVNSLVLALLDTFCACALALGRTGEMPLLSWMSIRMDMTPNVWEVSWYAIRLDGKEVPCLLLWIREEGPSIKRYGLQTEVDWSWKDTIQTDAGFLPASS